MKQVDFTRIQAALAGKTLVGFDAAEPAEIAKAASTKRGIIKGNSAKRGLLKISDSKRGLLKLR